MIRFLHLIWVVSVSAFPATLLVPNVLAHSSISWLLSYFYPILEVSPGLRPVSALTICGSVVVLTRLRGDPGTPSFTFLTS